MKRYAPAAERNCAPIVDLLKDWVPTSGRLVEIASGTGQHALAFAEAFVGLEVQPTEIEAAGRQSIDAYRTEAKVPNLKAAVELDVTWTEWPVAAADVIVAINMVHISPWAATLGLLDGAQRILADDGLLYLYGPYFVADRPVLSNIEFDLTLKHRNPDWGIRDLATVQGCAQERGLECALVQPMPANNLSLVFRRPR